ncbi:hypothetical protein EMPS_09591 [Entomortierella parvispora]|uniref:Nonsense-mediated mRNA decay factor SMG8 n=1 Tax=Entomortierella parvispora TaxID=205924 RepID=A0A9P3HIF9_9FUNG|nr:hypothetical protein EMPS_09591 [Entomortierella parvispora]
MQSHVHNDHIHRSGSTGSQSRVNRHHSRSDNTNVEHDLETDSLSSKRHGQGQGQGPNFFKGSYAQQLEVNYGRGSFRFGEDQTSSGMGDGIVNQNMRQDLSNWIYTLGMDPEVPIRVVGCFGQQNDLSFVKRVVPWYSESATGIDSQDESDPTKIHLQTDLTGYPSGVFEVFDENDEEEADGTLEWSLGFAPQGKRIGDIHIHIDRETGTLFLRHSYLLDSNEMLAVCLESEKVIGKDKKSLMKWMHCQEYESHRSLLFLFLVSHVVVCTSPDMNIDPRMITVLSTLSTIKRQISQELDRFMAICWDRIGVYSPDQIRQLTSLGTGSDDGGSSAGVGAGTGQRDRSQHKSNNSNSMANILTPGKCVPVLVFVIDKLPVKVPWHEPGMGDTAIVEQLRLQVLKKSVDALQTRLRYIFRAARLIQSIDHPNGAFDARQLFVLPTPSSTPFVYVIPQFIGRAHMASEEIVERSGKEQVGLDPAEAVLRQRTRDAAFGRSFGGSSRDGSGRGAKGRRRRGEKGLNPITAEGEDKTVEQEGKTSLSFGLPPLREFYEAATLVKDQPLSNIRADGRRDSRRDWTSTHAHGLVGDSAHEGDTTMTLGYIQDEYAGPLLREFVESWIMNVTIPGGYGNVVGKRNAGAIEVLTLQQWIAGYLGVKEALGFAPSASPVSNITGINSHSEMDIVNSSLSQLNVSTEDTPMPTQTQTQTQPSSKGRGRGMGKRYSQRCESMVHKKINDFVMR